MGRRLASKSVFGRVKQEMIRDSISISRARTLSAETMIKTIDDEGEKHEIISEGKAARLSLVENMA